LSVLHFFFVRQKRKKTSATFIRRHFLFAQREDNRRSNLSSQPHAAYYLQNIKMENSNSNGGQMKPSIKSADMKEVRHQKTTTNKRC